jgi:hypothetical protein
VDNAESEGNLASESGMENAGLIVAVKTRGGSKPINSP